MKSDFGDDVVGFDDFPRWGITCENRSGTPILAKFAEPSFRQIWRFFAPGSKVFGKCWQQHFWVPPACRSDISRHFWIARSAFFGGVLDAFRRGLHFQGGHFKLQFHQGCFVFFTGGSGWQMNEMMQKASAF